MEDDKKLPVVGDQSPKDTPTSTPATGSLSETTAINEKTLLRKIDLKLLPPLTLLYLLSFLDRSNGTYLSNIRVFEHKYVRMLRQFYI